MSLVDQVQRWWQDDAREDHEADRIGFAREFMDWYQMPHHKKFMAYLESQASAMFDLGQEGKLVAAAARSNSFREIMAAIEREHAAAADIIRSTGE